MGYLQTWCLYEGVIGSCVMEASEREREGGPCSGCFRRHRVSRYFLSCTQTFARPLTNGGGTLDRARLFFFTRCALSMLLHSLAREKGSRLRAMFSRLAFQVSLPNRNLEKKEAGTHAGHKRAAGFGFSASSPCSSTALSRSLARTSSPQGRSPRRLARTESSRGDRSAMPKPDLRQCLTHDALSRRAEDGIRRGA